jgi:hypothetical protein
MAAASNIEESDMKKRMMLLVVLAVALAGCGSSETMVTGLVTVNQQNLQRGYITFYPVEGTAATQGGEIVDGAFQIKQVPPGSRKVVIASTPNVEAVQHGEKGATLKILPGTQTITPKTQGNEQVVEIRSGKQTLDFALHNPPVKTPR